MASPDPIVQERQYYLDLLGVSDDPVLTIADLRGMTAGSSSVKSAADVGNGFDKKLYTIINKTTTTSRALLDSLFTKRNSTDVDVRTYGAKGDGVTDDSAAINQAITENPGRVVRLTSGAIGSSIYLIGDTKSILLNQPNTSLVLDQGTIVQYAPNVSGAYVIISITAADCKVSGGKIIGDVDAHVGGGGEWGFGVQIGAGAHRFRLDNVNISKCWGDGIYVGTSNVGAPEDVSISNVIINDNRRQGLSVIAAIRLRVSNSAFLNTGLTAYTAPGAGIDIEPNPATTDTVDDFQISNVICYNNKGGGVLVSPNTMSVTGHFIGVRSIANQGYGGFNFASGNASTRPIYVTNCISKDNTTFGFENASSGCPVIIKGCISEWNSSRGVALTSPGSRVSDTNISNNGGNGLVVNAAASGSIITNTTVSSSARITPGQNIDISANSVYLYNVISDAGSNVNKPAWGFVIRAGANDNEFYGCKSIGVYAGAGTGWNDAGTNTYTDHDVTNSRAVSMLLGSTLNKFSTEVDTLGAGIWSLRYLGGPAGATKTAFYYNRTNDILFIGSASMRPITDSVGDIGQLAQKWSRIYVNQIVQQITTKVANYNMVTSDHLVVGNAAGITISLPDPTTVSAGVVYKVKNIFAGNLTVNSQGAAKTIDGAASQVIAQWAKMQVVSDGAQWLTV